MIKYQEAVRLPCPVCGQSCRAEVVLKHNEAQADAPSGDPSERIRLVLTEELNLNDPKAYCPGERVEQLAKKIAGVIGEQQFPLGSAFTQIADDEGKCDLAALWQAVIDNTKGNGFWLGEILLTMIEQETGFNGSAYTRPIVG